MLCRGVSTGLLNKGGREQQVSWFSKQQAVEFPQVLTSNNYYNYRLTWKVERGKGPEPPAQVSDPLDLSF